ncbi:MAG: hypothetical protein O2958_11830 [Gemmatimonadetes bacterium]|nr:hypothetical protein [Gemmatimonadota bacterium]MDA1103909.1 hypothetical protein [Gemmatimonadota bacterium]
MKVDLKRVGGRLGAARLPWLRALLVVAAGAGLALSWTNEREGVARANRLFRAGRVEEATDIYQKRAARDDAAPATRYNLGTSLLRQDSPSAEPELIEGMGSAASEVRGRAQYNMGFSRLTRALAASESDSIRIHAEVSVAANRNALRLQPGDQDARWNLAMGLRLLDSITAAQRRSGREMADGAVQADVVVRSQNVPDAAEDEFAEDPPAEGENESSAVVGDESPLSVEEAEALLGSTHLDATQILGKLLALESRSRWGRQLGRGIRRW